MDAKIDLDSLKSILRDNLDVPQQATILREINRLLQEEAEEKAKEEEEKPPKIPKKAVIVLTSLPHGVNERDLEEISGFYTEINEDKPTRDVQAGVSAIRNAYNSSRKAKKNPAQSTGELFELAPAKLFKEEGIQKKPKGPLEFVYVPNR
jgi:hypothetical protein